MRAYTPEELEEMAKEARKELEKWDDWATYWCFNCEIPSPSGECPCDWDN